jgi:hypothetical protein
MIYKKITKCYAKFLSIITIAAFRCLAWDCRVDKWHFLNNYYNREYKKRAVALANTISIRTVAEVGCGFGDVISRVNAINKLAIDRDPNVIKVARRCCGSKIQFIQGSLDNLPPIDCCLLICLNWVHELHVSQLRSFLFNKKIRFKYILMDQILADTPNYPFYHKVEDFPECELVRLIGGGKGEPRNIVLMKNNRYEG